MACSPFSTVRRRAVRSADESVDRLFALSSRRTSTTVVLGSGRSITPPRRAGEGAAREARVHGGVAGGALLFMGGLLLLVDDDEAALLEGGEEGGRRPDDAVGRAVEPPPPLVVPLARGQRAVQERDPLAEAGHEAGDDLGGERDLRYEDDRALPARERLGRQPEVDLGLAAAGDPMQQEAAPGAHRLDDRRDRGGLRRRRGHVARQVVLAQAELDRHPPDAASAAEREVAGRDALRRLGGAAGLGQVIRGDRARRERAKGDELPRAELRDTAGERVPAGGRDAEDRVA